MTHPDIPFTPLVNSLPASTPFVGPETLERMRGSAFDLRLGANESPFGVSPKAAAAMQAETPRIAWYGDPENYDLRKRLSEIHGVAMDEICVGAGIDTMLGVIVRMIVPQRAPVVTSQGAYPTFNYQVAGYSGRLEMVPYVDDHEDPDSLIAAAKAHSAPLMYISNPDNPMGTWHGADKIDEMIKQVPAGTLLVLDEAYIEFAPEGTAPAIDTSNPRVIRMRTFSKAYGMAGARIGYAIGHRDLITGLNKIRNHFEVNRLAQVGALAALDDDAFIASVLDELARGKADIAEMAAAHGMTALPSATNFVAVDVGGPDKAKAILERLGEKGVFIRMPGVAPLNRCIRISVGTAAERSAFRTAFDSVLAELVAA